VSQDDDVLKQAVQRLWLNQVGPLDERCVIRHRVQIDPIRLSQGDAVRDEDIHLLVAPTVQMFHHQHLQDDLYGRGMTPSGQGVRMSLGQVALDVLKQRILLQRLVQLIQHFIRLERDQLRKVDRFVVYD
jgi:hypothetical protein